MSTAMPPTEPEGYCGTVTGNFVTSDTRGPSEAVRVSSTSRARPAASTCKSLLRNDSATAGANSSASVRPTISSSLRWSSSANPGLTTRYRPWASLRNTTAEVFLTADSNNDCQTGLASCSRITSSRREASDCICICSIV